MARPDGAALSVELWVEEKELEGTFVLGILRDLEKWDFSITPR